MLETVSNVISNTNSDLSADNGVSSSTIIQSMEDQVQTTLQQEGQLSIQEENVHVEGVSVDPMLASNGFSFVSAQQPGHIPSPDVEGTSLVGTKVMTFANASEIPQDLDVVASIRLPANIVDLIQSASGKYIPALFCRLFFLS